MQPQLDEWPAFTRRHSWQLGEHIVAHRTAHQEQTPARLKGLLAGFVAPTHPTQEQQAHDQQKNQPQCAAGQQPDQIERKIKHGRQAHLPRPAPAGGPAGPAILPARNLLNMVTEDGVKVRPTTAQRLNAAVDEAKETVSKTWIYVLIGVGAGAVIHGYLPISVIEKLDSYGPVIGVLVAVLVGMPLYSGIATVVPVISALAEKGMPMGTLLAFAMAVTGLSLPEAMLLRSVMKPKLLKLYFATVAIGIVVVGIAFNLLVG